MKKSKSCNDCSSSKSAKRVRFDVDGLEPGQVNVKTREIWEHLKTNYPTTSRQQSEQSPITELSALLEKLKVAKVGKEKLNKQSSIDLEPIENAFESKEWPLEEMKSSRGKPKISFGHNASKVVLPRDNQFVGKPTAVVKPMLHGESSMD